MWCNTARQPRVGGGQHDRPDRDCPTEGFGTPGSCAPGGGGARLARHLPSPDAAACTTGSGAPGAPGGAGAVAAQGAGAEGAGGGRRRPHGRTG